MPMTHINQNGDTVSRKEEIVFYVALNSLGHIAKR